MSSYVVMMKVDHEIIHRISRSIRHGVAAGLRLEVITANRGWQRTITE